MKRILIRDVFAVNYSGREFFRSDYKQATTPTPTQELYLAFVYTKFRGNFIGETLIVGSSKELDESAESLSGFSFLEDLPDFRCVEGWDDVALPPGIVGGIISAKPNIPHSDPGHPMRIRISESVAGRMLLKKIDRQYPDVPAQNRGDGTVLVEVVIDTSGNVTQVKVVSGEPSLTSVAVDAVKQWKYKPFSLEGQLVEAETRVTVKFQSHPK